MYICVYWIKWCHLNILHIYYNCFCDGTHFSYVDTYTYTYFLKFILNQNLFKNVKIINPQYFRLEPATHFIINFVYMVDHINFVYAYIDNIKLHRHIYFQSIIAHQGKNKKKTLTNVVYKNSFYLIINN